VKTFSQPSEWMNWRALEGGEVESARRFGAVRRAMGVHVSVACAEWIWTTTGGPLCYERRLPNPSKVARFGMLTRIRVQRFKSLVDTGPIEIAPLTVLFGPNAAGKSNFLDAVQVLSRLASERTLKDAFSEPVRGQPLEAFTFPSSGLPGLLEMPKPTCAFAADLVSGDFALRYSAEIGIHPKSGTLSVEDERLVRLNRHGEERESPRIERAEEQLRIRRRSKPGRPHTEKVGLSFTQLSDRRFGGNEYRVIEKARDELSSWRTYYLDPRVAMRAPRSPQEVDDIGPLGEYVAPYLYRLHSEEPKVFQAVKRTLRTLIRSVDDLSVDLDPKRGVLDVEVKQGGTAFSSRIISEGTLRVLALACVATNPWGGSLVAFEEPENGVHPRRIELIADMLVAMATQSPQTRQVVITTHSPIFCGAVLKYTRQRTDQIALYNVTRDGNATRLTRFRPTGPLFLDKEIREGLSATSDDAAVFEGIVLRGLLDG
jgi:predicted ATPase